MKQDSVKEKIKELVKSQYEDFKGKRMWALKELHNVMRITMGDEKYLEFLEKSAKENPRPVYKIPDELSSHSGSVEWEIKSFKFKNHFSHVVSKGEDGLFNGYKEENFLYDKVNSVLSGAIVIHSVLRKSDNSVWVVGEKTEHGVINKIEINESTPMIFYVGETNYPLYLKELSKLPPERTKQDENIQKPPLGVIPEYIHKEQRLDDIRQAMTRFNTFHKSQKHCPQEWLDEKHELEDWLIKREKRTKLFTTEDGVDVYSGIKVCQVSVLSWTMHDTIAREEITPPPSYFKYFSTREKAIEYVNYNKPCLSLNDLLTAWRSDEEFKRQCLAHSEVFYGDSIKNDHPLFKRFKQLAQTKIKL